MLSLLQCKIRNNLLNMQMWTVALNQPFCHFGRLGDHIGFTYSILSLLQAR